MFIVQPNITNYKNELENAIHNGDKKQHKSKSDHLQEFECAYMEHANWIFLWMCSKIGMTNNIVKTPKIRDIWYKNNILSSFRNIITETFNKIKLKELWRTLGQFKPQEVFL